MKESLVKDENYINIQGWMSTRLKLSGNELIIYALLYGFSQIEDHTFHGSLKYICDWTNISKTSCIANLKKLLAKKLIVKKEKEINGLKFCEYSTNLNTIQETYIPIQETLTNNIEYNIGTNKDNKLSLLDNGDEEEIKPEKSKKEDKILLENVKCIIDYLNESIGSKYRYNTKGTVNLIKARFKEGYELDDFYDVIDKKVKEWLNTDMQQYLRPFTLFGNKFENYLNQKNYFNGKPKTTYSSKPTFDNTANHFTGNKRITDEELDKMTFNEKVNYISNLPVADMTAYQKLFFENHCLARDENGNLLKF